MTFHWRGENSSEDPGREPTTASQVRLRTEEGSGRKLLCCEIFDWDRLASRTYAVTATTCLMKIVDFSVCMTSNLMDDLEKKASLFCYVKLCALFQSHQWTQTEVNSPAMLNSGHNCKFFVLFDGWPWKNYRAPLLCYFKLCASFRSHLCIQTHCFTQMDRQPKNLMPPAPKGGGLKTLTEHGQHPNLTRCSENDSTFGRPR